MSNFVPKITRWVSKELTICECPESRKTLIFQGFLGHHKNFLHLFDTIRRAGPRSHTQGDTKNTENTRRRPAGDIYRPRGRGDTEKVFADRGAGGFCEGIRGIAAAGAWNDGGRVRQGHGDSRERAMPQGADG